MVITHSKVSAKPDGADNTKVQPSDWNAEHVIADGYFLPRISTQTFTDADIKAAGTPMVLVAATETLGYSGAPGQIVLPLSVIVRVDTAAGAYSNIDTNAQFLVAWGSDWSIDFMYVKADNLDATAAAHMYAPQFYKRTTNSALPDTPHSHTLQNVLSGFHIDDNIRDNALVLVLDNGSSGNLTGGDAANSLKATVIYTVIDL